MFSKWKIATLLQRAKTLGWDIDALPGDWTLLDLEQRVSAAELGNG